jgi:hypothetical protein
VVASIQHTYEVNVVAFPDGRTVTLSPISWSIYGPQPPEISEEEASKKAIAWEKERDSEDQGIMKHSNLKMKPALLITRGRTL